MIALPLVVPSSSVHWPLSPWLIWPFPLGTL